MPTLAAASLQAKVDRDHRVGPLLRLPVAILDLDSPAAAAQGRSSQAVRTNCHRALEAGCVATEVGPSDRDALNEAACAWWLSESGERRTGWPFTGDQSQVAVAGRSANGELLVCATATVMERWAYLDLFLRCGTSPETSACRYLTHITLVEALRSNKVEHLAAEGPLTLSAGLRYQQHRFGFQAARLTITREP